MKTSDFKFDLPQELIAQTPIKNRSDSKLLVVERNGFNLIDDHFYNVLDYLKENSVLVINNTKVVPARIIGKKVDTGATIELLILNNIENDLYECLAKPQKRLKVGTVVNFGNILKATVKELKDDGITIVNFEYEGIFYEVLDKIGEMPLPPYIHNKLKDKSRYQTVYSKIEGSSAAPTAGLHFTKEILESLKTKNIQIVEVTLKIGLGTFRPVTSENIEDHKMHSEKYSISKEAANILNKAKKEGREIVAVGTTSIRTLESNYKKFGCFKEETSDTSIFIYPGIKVESVDSLITNFHLPESTLIMLVSAFASKDIIMNAYKHAVLNKYRFFSFGDAMLIKK